MKILITGITGFLGRHIATSLLGAGHEVTGIARKVPSAPLPPGARFVQGSISDEQVIAPLLERAEALVHLAWEGTPGSSQGLPRKEISANVLPSAVLIEELQKHASCKILFVSTGGALYPGNGRAAVEEDGVAPRSYYGAAKGAVELMLHALCEQAGHRVTVVRPTNVYGPGQASLPGFGVIPALMRCARDGIAFECWGSGAIARDFLYIADFVDIVLKALHADIPGSRFHLLNVGSGNLVSLDELRALISRVSGHEIEWRVREARAVDPPQVLVDNSRAKAILAWTPKTSIEQGLRLTWDSWRPHR